MWIRLKSFWQQADEGYLLIEMAIALAVMGVLLGVSLPLITHIRHVERHQLTRKHQEYVLWAIGLYVSRTQELPCPSQKDAKGVAQGRMGLCAGDKGWYGYIPFETLGIPEAMTKDGYGHPMRLAVHPELAHGQVYCTLPWSPGFGRDKIQVQRDGQRSVVAPGPDQFVVVALIAEGEAYQLPKSLAEEQNVQGTGLFHDRAYAQNRENPFRHMVGWATWQHLAAYYGNNACPKTRLMTDQDVRPGARAPSNPAGSASRPAPVLFRNVTIDSPDPIDSLPPWRFDPGFK